MWKDSDGKLHTEEPMDEERITNLSLNVEQFLRQQRTLTQFHTALGQLTESMKEQGVNLRYLRITEQEPYHTIRMDCWMFNEDGTPYGRKVLNEEATKELGIDVYSYPDCCPGWDLKMDKAFFKDA